jgi:hypothetical protein
VDGSKKFAYEAKRFQTHQEDTPRMMPPLHIVHQIDMLLETFIIAQKISEKVISNLFG